MTKSSKINYNITVSLGETYSAEEACRVAHISRDLMYRLARDEDDPFPLRYYDCKVRDGFVLRGELIEWIKRNTAIGGLRRR
jgi:hypothetical protein